MRTPIILLECKRCGARWTPRVPDPRQCPVCKSPHWRTPPKYRRRDAVQTHTPTAPAAGEQEG